MQTDRLIHNPLDIHSQSLAVKPEDIYIFPIPKPLYQFLENIWQAMVNKMVSLVYFNNEPCFSYSMFEVIDKDLLRVVATTTHFKLKELALKRKIPSIEEFLQNAEPIPIADSDNESARFIQKAIIDFNKGLRPEVIYIDLKKSKIHPKKRALLSDTMNYAIGIPLFVVDSPIGILWGITKDPVAEDEIKQLRQQMSSLFDVIDYVISKELNERQDHYIARKNIEKADTHSNSKNLFYTKTPGQSEPVTSIIFKSHAYNKEYRMDASYIIPTANGYAVSIKQFLPEDQNKTKKNVLMIPGFFCRRSVMDKLAREMALRHGYRVFSMDMRGRSRQTMPRNGKKEGWTVDNYVQDDFPEVIRYIRDQYPDEQIVVMGHSMGGMIPRFYTSSFETIKKLKVGADLPVPKDNIAGIVSITSPNYISVKSNFLGIETLKQGLNLIPNKTITDSILSLASFGMQSTIQTIDLKRFFKFLLNLHDSLRNFSYDIGTKVITIQDFVGYKEITPSEWYFLVEDVFCEESVSVIMQFVHSQVSKEKAFLSSDGTINYTENLKNFNIPLYSVIGTVDKIVPLESIKPDLEACPAPKKVITEYEQGHLGILFHPPTVTSICEGVDKWIKTL